MNLDELLEKYCGETDSTFNLMAFANSTFGVLETMSMNQAFPDDGPAVIMLTKEQIADISGEKYSQINRIMKKLFDGGFIVGEDKQYYITERGAKAIRLMRKPNC